MFVLIIGIALLSPQEEIKLTQTESRMIEAINNYRARYKLPPLTADPTLMKVARYRVPHYTHCYQGRWIWDECKRYGFDGQTTDNLAQGQTSPDEAVDCWAESTVGHAKQMRGLFNMNRRWVDYRFDKVGVARSGQNWIAIFGRRDH
jgi:uncharacterized protein YkwD